MDNYLCLPQELDNKELYREMFNIPLRREVQPNAGRIQQFGKESYCDAYTTCDTDMRDLIGFKNCFHREYYEWKEPVKVLPNRFLSWIFAKYVALEAEEKGENFVVVDLTKSVHFGGVCFIPQQHQAAPQKIKCFNRFGHFIEAATRLDKLGNTDAALDLIYDKIDKMLTEGQFSLIDSVLNDLDVEIHSVDILLGLLTSTLPAKTKLQGRKAFFLAVEQDIKRRGEWEEGLLTGLES
jgi:hypothetical protein